MCAKARSNDRRSVQTVRARHARSANILRLFRCIEAGCRLSLFVIGRSMPASLYLQLTTKLCNSTFVLAALSAWP